MSFKFRIAFSLACAALAALLCVNYAEPVRAEAERTRDEAIARYGGEVVRLVVSRGPLEPGDVVDQADVSERDWVTDLAPSDALTSLDDVVGREVTVPVAANAPVTALAFRDVAAMADIPAGHVALSIPITDKLGVSRSIGVGTGVIGYVVDDKGSTPIATDATVLASPGETSGLGTGGQLTLAIRSEDVDAVLSASAAGTLRIVVPADDVEGLDRLRTSAPQEIAEAER